MIIKLFQIWSIPSHICFAAGIFSLFFAKRLHGYEKLIIVIIWINIFANFIASLMSIINLSNEMVYNISIPVEHIVTLIIYARGAKTKKIKDIHFAVIVLIFLLSFSNYFIVKNPYGVHFYTILLSAIIISIFSYWQLKVAIVKTSSLNSAILWFSLANLVYYPLMVVSMGALPIANDISKKLALSFYTINDVGFTIWTLLITFGIIWNKKKNT